MASYSPPNPYVPKTFNPSQYILPSANITEQYLAENYLKFPYAQGTENFVGLTNLGQLQQGGQAEFSSATNPAIFNQPPTITNPVPDTSTTPTDAVATIGYVLSNVAGGGDVYTDVANVFQEVNTFESGIEIGPVGGMSNSILTNTTGFLECNTDITALIQGSYNNNLQYGDILSTQAFVQSAYNQTGVAIETLVYVYGANTTPTYGSILTTVSGSVYKYNNSYSGQITINAGIIAGGQIKLIFPNTFITFPITFTMDCIFNGITYPLTITSFTSFGSTETEVIATGNLTFSNNETYEFIFNGYNTLIGGGGGGGDVYTNIANVFSEENTFPSVLITDGTQGSTLSFIGDYLNSSSAMSIPLQEAYSSAISYGEVVPTQAFVQSAIASVPPIPSNIAFQTGNNTFSGTNTFDTSIPTSTVAQTYPNTTNTTEFSTIKYVNDAIASVPPIPSNIAIQTGNNTFSGTNTFDTSIPTSTVAQSYPSTDTTQFATIGYVNSAGGGGGDVSLAGDNPFTGDNTFSALCGTATTQTVPISNPNQFTTSGYINSLLGTPYPYNSISGYFSVFATTTVTTPVGLIGSSVGNLIILNTINIYITVNTGVYPPTNTIPFLLGNQLLPTSVSVQGLATNATTNETISVNYSFNPGSNTVMQATNNSVDFFYTGTYVLSLSGTITVS